MAKTKALISFAVTPKLISVFVFAYAKSRFSHGAAHISYEKANNSYNNIILTPFRPEKGDIFALESIYPTCDELTFSSLSFG